MQVQHGGGNNGWVSITVCSILPCWKLGNMYCATHCWLVFPQLSKPLLCKIIYGLHFKTRRITCHYSTLKMLCLLEKHSLRDEMSTHGRIQLPLGKAWGYILISECIKLLVIQPWRVVHIILTICVSKLIQQQHQLVTSRRQDWAVQVSPAD